jgi:hypothetical protein
MPTATDLVTDLPADFEVFGQAVDTRLKALQPGTTLGDIVYSSATANTSTRLPIGTTGQVLSVVAGVPAWQTGTTGDITGVTAGTGISGGGTSGDVTITNSMATAIDAKGDLVAGTAADTFSRLAVGSNDLILTAASGEATGLKWSGAWTTYTPTWTNLTVGNGTLTARYCQIGKIVMGYISFTMGSTSSMGTAPYFTLPVTAFSSTGNIPLGNFYMEDVGVQGGNGVIASRNTTTAQIVAIFASGTYIGGNASISATIPFTWGTSDFFNGYFIYEAA